MEELSHLLFTFENCSRSVGEPQPWYFVGTTCMIKDGWEILGWCDASLLGALSRPKQIAVMFSTPNGEECWFHAVPELLKLNFTIKELL